MDILFLGTRVNFGVSDFSVVLVDVVVATKLEPVSVLLFCITAVVSCMFSKIVVGVVEPDGVLKSVWSWLAVGSEPKFHASFSSVPRENRDGELSGVRVSLKLKVGVETHPGVGFCDSGENWRHHKPARSIQARTTSNLFSKKGKQSQSYSNRIVRILLAASQCLLSKEDVLTRNVERTRLKW